MLIKVGLMQSAIAGYLLSQHMLAWKSRYLGKDMVAGSHIWCDVIYLLHYFMCPRFRRSRSTYIAYRTQDILVLGDRVENIGL